MNHKSFPNAKINLGLYVTERRPDGYHNIETVFYPVPLCDEIIIEEEDEDQLLLSGIPVAGSLEDNLVMKALYQLRRDYDIPCVSISLKKNIPSGAGLGGGSSDAAFTIKMLNDMFYLGMTNEEMEKRASALGADCAFFIKNAPTLAKGIGNEFSHIDIDLTGWHLVLVKPNEFVSTKEAYSMITPQMPKHDIRESIARPVTEWNHLLFNDFEDSVFPRHNVIRDIKKNLYSLGATYASMSGSGSCVYALFDKKPKELSELFEPHFYFSAQL